MRAFKQLISTLAVLLIVASAVPAQKGAMTYHRIRFARGQTNVVLKGQADWGAGYAYLLQARRGQQLTVSIVGVPTFRILLPKARQRNNEALPGADFVKEWKGELPEAEVYQIVVSHSNNDYTLATYTLNVAVR